MADPRPPHGSARSATSSWPRTAYPTAIAIAPDGALWFVDSGNARVRRIATDGTIATIAGTGTWGTPPATGGPAATTDLATGVGLAVTPDGRAHLVTDHRVFAIVVHDEPPMADAGTGGPDAGTPVEGGGGGCGCETTSSTSAWPLGLGVLAMITRRRRQRRSQAFTRAAASASDSPR